MSESKHLAQSLKRLYFGDTVGVFAPFEAATDGLSARQAVAVPMPRFNSVAGIVNHVWFWQEALRLLLLGETCTHEELGAPDESGWPPAGGPQDEEGWIRSRTRALDVNTALSDLVARLPQEELESRLEAWGTPKHRAVQSIIAHNSYHTAEIICVRHMQGFWMEST